MELLGAGDGDVVECLVDGEQAHDVGLDGGGVAVKAELEILEFGAEFVSDGDGVEMMPHKVQPERNKPGADAVVEAFKTLFGSLVDAIVDFAHGQQAALHHLVVVEMGGFLHGAHVEPLDAGEVEEFGSTALMRSPKRSMSSSVRRGRWSAMRSRMSENSVIKPPSESL